MDLGDNWWAIMLSGTFGALIAGAATFGGVWLAIRREARMRTVDGIEMAVVELATAASRMTRALLASRKNGVAWSDSLDELHALLLDAFLLAGARSKYHEPELFECLNSILESAKDPKGISEDLGPLHATRLLTHQWIAQPRRVRSKDVTGPGLIEQYKGSVT